MLLQYDTFDIGFITTDDFGNADILEATYPAVAKRLHGDWIRDPAIPIVTGFLGKVFSPEGIHYEANY
jgi:aspartate kinase